MSIRAKILAGFLLFILIGIALGGTFYYKQYILQNKVRLLDLKSELLNVILEARRYEKNYLLYHRVEDLEDTVSYVELAKKYLDDIVKNYVKHAQSKDFSGLLKKLDEYQDILGHLIILHRNGQAQLEKSPNYSAYSLELLDLRELGRDITLTVEDMLKKERLVTESLLKVMKTYHFIALSGVILSAIILVIFLTLSVLKPLMILEDAIHKIRLGDYQHVPQIKTGDEFESLVESINKMIEELEKRNQKLIQTEKMASLGTLTAGVAHELNNPLNNISTSLQILLEELEDGDLEYQRFLLTEAEKQVERAKDIIKALLEFSRDKIFELKETNVYELIHKTVSLIKPEIPSEVQVKIQVPENLVAKIDPNKIQQVLINLMMNALLAMNGNGILTIEASELDNNRFFIKVSDTGIGIPQENLSKIFDPFFTTWESGKGSGLGLSVSRDIVVKHGGEITVKSVPDKGTTFTIVLPKGDWQ